MLSLTNENKLFLRNMDLNGNAETPIDPNKTGNGVSNIIKYLSHWC